MNKLVVASVAASIPTIAPAIASDPVFVAIEVHRTAAQVYAKCVDNHCALERALKGPDWSDDPSYNESMKATDEACNAMFDLARGLLDVQPTSIAGAIALLNYVAAESRGSVSDSWQFPDYATGDYGTGYNDDGERGETYMATLLRHIAEALSVVSAVKTGPVVTFAPTTRPTSTDAKLISLCREYEPMLEKYLSAHKDWSRGAEQARIEQDAEFGEPKDFDYKSTPEMRAALEKRLADTGATEANDRMDEISLGMEPIGHAINSIPASSVEGLRAKALVALYNIRPIIAGREEFAFDDEVAFQHLFCGVAEFVGLAEMVADSGYVMPDLFEFDEDDVIHERVEEILKS
ncbi:hypothetical protein [Bradyrhizobium sp.]|uniref:hypothetical protein n=1 Tax=Bradyrhizobium sp. TaxID=376 RepID=UPI002D4803DA|nr:hypothetical protein [Bradyrhizobium sp.]HZR74536.1 hypothetical protein [Bradyrhizobium sp.]